MTVHWKNRPIDNWDEALSAALKLRPQEAEAFLEAFRQAGCPPEKALEGLSYFTGNYNPTVGNEMLRKLRELFGEKAQHPVFGDHIPEDPRDQIAIGMAIGESLRSDKKDRS